jgi:hypothetical protein
MHYSNKKRHVQVGGDRTTCRFEVLLEKEGVIIDSRLQEGRDIE